MCDGSISWKNSHKLSAEDRTLEIKVTTEPGATRLQGQ